MSDETFAVLDELQQSTGAQAAIDKLVETLRDRREYHRLFDALLLKKKHELGLPVEKPTAFDDVPDEQREEFEQCYVDSAREVGQLFLDDGKIAQAWVYFRTIRETEPVAAAIEAMPTRREVDEQTEELINIALYEGANPVKGLELLLHSHGTCNTVTALDQQLAQLSPDDRKRAAALLVRELHRDLSHTLRHEVEQRLALVPPGESITELIAGRDWLFEEGNYHIDVSHLNAVVRFARSLDESCPELPLAIELAEYGARLDPQFQYAGDPPFDEFYPAHLHFLKAIADKSQDASLSYFREKLDAESEQQDKQMIAYVMVDLCLRTGRFDQAIELGESYLKDLDESSGFSFADLCRQSNRMDVLQKVAREKGDLVSYTAALIQNNA